MFEPIRDDCQKFGIALEVVDLRWGKHFVVFFLLFFFFCCCPVATNINVVTLGRRYLNPIQTGGGGGGGVGAECARADFERL